MTLNKLKRRLRALLRKQEFELELDEELRFHLEREIAQNLQNGMGPEEARYAALRSFGGIEQAKEECRDARGVRLIEQLWQDLRYGQRMLLKNPGFTAVAVLTVALGISATTCVFSVVNTVLLHPLPYKAPERLVIVWDRVARLGLNRNIVSPANYFDWQHQNRVFETMGAYTEAFFNLTDDDGGNPERIAAMIVTPSLFPTLGVRPALGRAFLVEKAQYGGDTNPTSLVIISHSLRERRFGSDPNPIGKTITLNGTRYDVAGVMPEEFMFSGKQVEVFLPFAPNPEQMQNRRGRYLTVIARLKPDASLKQAQAEMDSIAARLAEEYPDVDKDRGANVSPLEEEVFGTIRRTLLVLLAAVGLVLLITSANYANLLLARFTSRRRETAIRTALGATRLRVVRQLFAESIPLTFVGGVLGLLLARWGVRLIVALSPASIPRISDVRLDSRVLGFTVAVSVLTGVIFGLLPALQASKTDFHVSLKESSKTTSGGAHRRAQNTLVIVEVAFSMVLLVGAGLMVKTLILLVRVDPGFVVDQTVAMDLSLPNSYRGPQPRARFFQQLIQRVEALPGVRSAGVTDNLPLSGEDASRPFTIVANASSLATEKLAAEHRRVSTHYFDAMGITVLKGRAFNENDTDQSPGVVIINESLARHFLPNQDPLGERLIIDDGPPRLREIIGVVRDVKHFSLDVEARPEMYVPHIDRPWPNMTIVVRAVTGEPGALATAVRGEVSALDRAIPVANVKTMDQYLAASIGQRRFTMFLLGGFGALALLLAAIGIYGVTSYAVTQRTQEVGIRMALGAQTSDVLRLIIWQGTRLTIIGAVIGLVAAFWLTRLMESLLFGVTANDSVTFVAVTLSLGGVALLACYIPARRATKVDPLIALRYE